MVEHLHRGRRVVDCRGQRLDGDVDEDPQREGRVLLDRALAAEGEQLAQAGPPAGGLPAVDLARTVPGVTKSPTERASTIVLP